MVASRKHREMYSHPLDASAVLSLYGVATLPCQELYHLAREDVLDVVSEGAESCDNWRKPVSARCADANDCGKGGRMTIPTVVVPVTLTVPATFTD